MNTIELYDHLADAYLTERALTDRLAGLVTELLAGGDCYPGAIERVPTAGIDFEEWEARAQTALAEHAERREP